MTGSRERGSATVTATILVGLLTLAALVAASAAALYVGHRRAATAADLAALAGASALLTGVSGCDAADSIARANHAELVRCEAAGGVLTVRVSFEVPTMLPTGLSASLPASLSVPAVARAGPAGALADPVPSGEPPAG